MAGDDAKAPSRHGWLRTNVEALTLAVALALVIKTFLFDTFQVPTESMEPTIIGEVPGGDHILASRIPYAIRDPRRYEIAVFRYPLSRLVSYVKRVCGLPGERVRIVRGDLFVATGPEAPLAIARKPDALRTAILRAHPALPPASFEDFSDAVFGPWWRRPPRRSRVVEGGRALELDAREAACHVTLSPDVGVSDIRRDARAIERQGGDAGPRNFSGHQPVGDLRLEIDVEPGPATKVVSLRLVDCTLPSRPLELRLAVTGSDRSRLMFGAADLADDRLGAFRLASGQRSQVALENVDDRIRVIVDDEVVFTHDYDQPLEAAVSGSSHAACGASGGLVLLRRLALLRDLHYVIDRQNPVAEFQVPDDSYLMLGDNAPSSLDSRGWRAVGIRLREDGRILIGDLDGITDTMPAMRLSESRYAPVRWLARILEPLGLDEPTITRHGNPWIDPADREVHRFLDLHGNLWRLAPESYDILDLNRWADPTGRGILARHLTRLENDGGREIAYRKVSSRTLGMLSANGPGLRGFSARFPFVPRSAIQARALAVFLPLDRASAVR